MPASSSPRTPPAASPATASAPTPCRRRWSAPRRSHGTRRARDRHSTGADQVRCNPTAAGRRRASCRANGGRAPTRAHRPGLARRRARPVGGQRRRSRHQPVEHPDRHQDTGERDQNGPQASAVPGRARPGASGVLASRSGVASWVRLAGRQAESVVDDATPTTTPVASARGPAARCGRRSGRRGRQDLVELVLGRLPTLCSRQRPRDRGAPLSHPGGRPGNAGEPPDGDTPAEISSSCPSCRGRARCPSGPAPRSPNRPS
jgi:hypothetical protein